MRFDPMQYEVEQKHRLGDPSTLLTELERRTVSIGPAQQQSDVYYNHPGRDFAQTDEALRIRRVGDSNLVTYKGPKVDAASKTRQELEIGLADGEEAAAVFAAVLEALGFAPVLEVTKSRRLFALASQGHAVNGALDEVEGLGSFVELELTADAAGLDEARRVIAELADELQLGPGERRSYLEMLLDG